MTSLSSYLGAPSRERRLPPMSGSDANRGCAPPPPPPHPVASHKPPSMHCAAIIHEPLPERNERSRAAISNPVTQVAARSRKEISQSAKRISYESYDGRCPLTYRAGESADDRSGLRKRRYRRRCDTGGVAIQAALRYRRRCDTGGVAIQAASRYRRRRDTGGVAIQAASRYRRRRDTGGVAIQAASRYRRRRDTGGVAIQAASRYRRRKRASVASEVQCRRRYAHRVKFKDVATYLFIF